MCVRGSSGVAWTPQRQRAAGEAREGGRVGVLVGEVGVGPGAVA